MRDVNKTTVCGLEVTREHVTGYARQTETATTEDVIVKRTSRSGQDYTEWAAVPIMEAPLRETVRAITCAPCRQAYERDTYGRASR